MVINFLYSRIVVVIEIFYFNVEEKWNSNVEGDYLDDYYDGFGDF